MTTATLATDGAPEMKPCGCPQDATRAAPSRRSLLRAMVAGGALGAAQVALGPDTHTQYAFGAPGAGDTIVILSLRGGFDGLAAVAPLGDPHYATSRPGMLVQQSQAIMLDQRFGLHPKLAPLKPLWDNKTLAIVTDVGQATPSRSHFDAMAEMERAAPGSGLRTGWIDRLASARGVGGPLAVAQVGSGSMPPSFIGPFAEGAIPSVERYELAGTDSDHPLERWAPVLTAMHADAPAPLSAALDSMLDGLRTMESVRTRSSTPHPSYPRESYDASRLTPLAQALADTARLVRSDVGLSVATIDSGDWDIHEGSGIHEEWGRTPRQLDELGRALAAFASDLGSALNTVTLVTLSEFGRRVHQNGTDGTDHGHGNMVFVLGGGINGGRFHGTWPSLDPAGLVDGDLPGRTDYRNVLANVLARRAGTSSSHLSSTFPGLRLEPLDIAQPR